MRGLVIAVGVLITFSVIAGDPPKPPQAPDEPEIKKRGLGDPMDVDDRVNGLLLKIDAKQRTDALRDRIEISWHFDYAGPRRPLIILKPDIHLKTSGQTRLLITATGKSHDNFGYSLSSPSPQLLGPAAEIFRSKREWFFKPIDGQNAGSGSFEIVTADIKRFLTKKLPNEFDVAKPPPLYLRLIHGPRDRGEHLGLDAWTGEVSSPEVRVELKEW